MTLLLSPQTGRRKFGASLWLKAALLVSMGSSISLAVHPRFWNHQNTDDFADGRFQRTLVNNYGEVTLGRELKSLYQEGNNEFVNALAMGLDGSLYFATARDGQIYRRQGDKAHEFFKPPAALNHVLSLGFDRQGRLLVGCSGPSKGALLRVSTDGTGKVVSETIFQNSQVHYIWAQFLAPDGTLYLGTGPKGQIWQIAPDGKASQVLETSATNILCLAMDKDSRLLAGTDGTGLVIRIGPKGHPYVLLDAGSTDISALALDAKGNLYVATASGESSRSDALDFDAPKGKPDTAEPDALEPEAVSTPILPGVRPARVILAASLEAAEVPTPRAAADKKKKKKRPTTGSSEKSSKLKSSASTSELRDGTNVVYQITPDGTPHSLMTSSEPLLSLALRGSEVLVGAGSGGKLWSLQPESETQTLLATLREEALPAILVSPDGRLFVGTSNKGQLLEVGAAQATEGTFVSKVLDSGASSRWGTLWAQGQVPPGTRLTIATRSGNVQDVQKNPRYWSDWSSELPIGEYLPISSPRGRYLQYRVSLGSSLPEASPVLQQIRIAYQSENQPPKITRLSVETEGEAKGGPREEPHKLKINWDASDPNNDDLVYRVLAQQQGSTPAPQATQAPWIQLAKELKETTFTWDTTGQPDGYYQIKVVASDLSDNSPGEALRYARTSSPVLVDNTPPTISEIKFTVENQGKVRLHGLARDALSPLSEVRFQIDSEVDWQAADASDKIFDSPVEGFVALTRPLAPGPHRITFRATDLAGNSGYRSVTVSVMSGPGRD